MTDRISDILFHPSTLIQYKKTNFFKVLLYLIILTCIASIVPVIEVFKFNGYSDVDQPMFEESYKIDFSDVVNYPNCKLVEKQFTCENETDYKEIASFNVFKVVFDENLTNKKVDNEMYIKFTKNNIKVTNNLFNYLIIDYDDLPSDWQSFDFETIKQSVDPEEAYYQLFVSGMNELRQEFIGYQVLVTMISIFILVLFEILFYSLMFFLLSGRKVHKFKHVFKVAVFAYTLPVIIGLFFSLIHIQIMSSTILAILTIIYMHIALMPKEVSDN